MQVHSLNRQQSRRVDEIAIGEFGIPGIVLMENAGRNCAMEIEKHILSAGNSDPAVLIACGAGNNGGDGYVIARHLTNLGIPVKIVSISKQDRSVGDAAVNQEIATKMQILMDPFFPASPPASIQASLLKVGSKPTTIFVDALLGTGARGNPRPPMDRIIDIANDLSFFRIAIDIPSGLDCDTGVPNDPTFVSDLTLTLATRKVGFDLQPAKRFLGKVSVIDIGIPQKAIKIAKSS
jgi:NAD(P)H-hydrate epimerase